MKEVACLLIVLVIIFLASVYDDFNRHGGITLAIDGGHYTLSWLNK